MRYLILSFLFVGSIKAQRYIMPMYFDHCRIGLFPRYLDLSDTSKIPLEDTIVLELDEHGRGINYCLHTYAGDCDFFLYDKQRLSQVIHYKHSEKMSNRKTKIYYVDPTTFEKVFRYENAYKAERCGIWIYFDKKGSIKQKVFY
jgi:hypothetical protein